jgi:hypothetical protein
MTREKEKIDGAYEGCIMKSYDGVMGYDTHKVGGKGDGRFQAPKNIEFQSWL